MTNFGRKQVYVPPEGAIRRSQVVSTFGPGAMVDLLDSAVLISGLDFWNYPAGVTVLEDTRLRDALAKRFREAGLGELAVEGAFREPPACDDKSPSRATGVQALEFPQWFVCQRENCRALTRARDALERKGTRYVHACADGKRGDCVPVRFVGACTRGHLEDWPWISFCHREKSVCNAPDLRLEEGATGDFSEILVHCRTCQANNRLTAALNKDIPQSCGGHRPWLGSQGIQPGCKDRLRLLVRTATNSYFPQVESALSIPDDSRDLADAVASSWKILSAATPVTLPAFRTIPDVQEKIGRFSDAAVLAAVQARRDGKLGSGEPLRTAEYRKFIAADLEVPGDFPTRRSNFFIRRLDAHPGDLPAGVKAIVLGHRLREVRVQVGFTRIEPVSPDLQGEHDLGVSPATLSLTKNWLPATEVHGEGIFLQLDELLVQKWEERPAVERRADELLAGFNVWAARFDEKLRPRFPGIRYYLLHSLSHLLITAMSLECGYSASSIRERIYCAPREDPYTPMAALLLSTGSPGTEGTLGGLVEQGRYLRAHLRHAFDLGVLCSNDPVCARHNPHQDASERYLHGAACHGCLFIAESSCERFNSYLDRALVLPTIGCDPSLAFFPERP